MGRTAKDAKLTKGWSDPFEPLELNAVNVRAVFDRCGKLKEDGSAEWNAEHLKKNRAHIRYLLGQLALVHAGVQVHALKAPLASGMKRYDGKSWTRSSKLAMALLRMGENSDFWHCDEQDGRLLVEWDLRELKPTLSPKDPKFEAWWDMDEALLVRIKIAEDEHKLDEVFSSCVKEVISGNAAARYHCGLMYGNDKDEVVARAKALYWCEKAAEQGDADAQYRCGEMYAWGNVAAKGKERALYWFEKAAEQGHAEAQFNCAVMYGRGEGTAVDKAKAKMWYQKAAAQDTSELVQRMAKSFLQEDF